MNAEPIDVELNVHQPWVMETCEETAMMAYAQPFYSLPKEIQSIIYNGAYEFHNVVFHQRTWLVVL